MSIFTPIDNKKNFELIIGQMMDLMREGKLKPGDRIIPERELAQILNVSRSSLREAFKVLEVIDLLEVKPREGTFLKEPSISSLMKLLPMMLVAKQNEPNRHRELYEIRSGFETYASRMAAQRRTDENLERMEQELETLRTSDVIEELIQADINFHKSITEATGNTLIIAVMEVIAGLMQYNIAFIKTTLATKYEDYNAINYQQHYEIYEAIKDQNEDLAEEKMAYHFDYSYVRIQSEEQVEAGGSGYPESGR